MHFVFEGLNTTISICVFYAIQYDYDLRSFFVLFPSPLIFGYITVVNSFFDLIMHLVFDSLNTWVGTTISLFFFSRSKFPQSVRHSKIVSFRINRMLYTLTHVPGGDDLV
jgi:hypothetical protein